MNLNRWYAKNYQLLHPIELASRVHVDFVGIHPFIDGNGRTASLLMNLELMKAGFPPSIIRVEDRLAYYTALDIAHTTKNYEPYFYVLGI